MKAEVFATVNFPVYAVSAFEYGNAIDEEDNYNPLVNWELQLRAEITSSGFRLLSIEFGDEEYFSKTPIFGAACTCVEATIYAEKM